MKSDDWIGSKDWWQTVLSMPIYESLQHLHEYRCMLLENNPPGSKQYGAGSHLLARVNDEIKRSNRLIDQSNLKRVAREVLPPEWHEELLAAIRLAEMDRPDLKGVSN